MAEAGSPGDRDITVGRRSSPEESAFYTNSWALVVGLNRYEDKRIPALQYAERDAEDIASLLLSLGFPADNIRIVLGSHMKVTPELISKFLLEDLNPKMAPDDRLLLYVAGHGVSTEVHGERRGYLLVPNSEIYGEWPTGERPYLTRPPAPAVPMVALLDSVSGLPAKHKLVLIDSCFSGFMAQSRGVREVEKNDPRLAQWTREPVTQVLTAGRSGQTSSELDKYGHGVFTHYVLSGLRGNADLRGDGLIAFSDLVSFVKNRVADDPDVDQDPQPGTFGEGEFVFVHPELAEIDQRRRKEATRRAAEEAERQRGEEEARKQQAEAERKEREEAVRRDAEEAERRRREKVARERWRKIVDTQILIVFLSVGGVVLLNLILTIFFMSYNYAMVITQLVLTIIFSFLLLNRFTDSDKINWFGHLLGMIFTISVAVFVLTASFSAAFLKYDSEEFVKLGLQFAHAIPILIWIGARIVPDFVAKILEDHFT